MTAAIALAGLAIAGLTGGVLAGGRPDPPPGDPGDGDGGGGGMMDDEAIGSLPAQHGEVLFLVPGAPPAELPPRLYLAGPTDAILAALIDAHGTGHVSMHPGAEPGHSLAIVHGTLHLALDASLFTNPEVSTGVLVGVELRRTVVGLFHAGRLVSRAELEPGGRLPVPIGGLFEHGLLKDGVDLFAARARGGRDHVRITAHGGVVSLHQMN